ncbi:hypothetical protein Q5A_020615 [Serratia inhibens PRI-2C]|nr:hypothetical protein Q5A_020615 [Serratia inhibens PRI-2C]
MKTNNYKKFKSLFLTKRAVLLTVIAFSMSFWMVIILIIILLLE